jgi:hypothetical protein
MAELTWADAVSELLGARTKAEASVSLLKRYGEQVHEDQARLLFADAKIHADAIIAGLITAVSGKGFPERLSSLLERTEHVQIEVAKLRNLAEGLIPRFEGVEGIKDPGEILQGPFGESLQKMSNAVTALYHNFRAEEEATRKIILTYLEEAHWLEFDQLREARDY